MDVVDPAGRPETALALARRGLYVLPLWCPLDGGCWVEIQRAALLRNTQSAVSSRVVC